MSETDEDYQPNGIWWHDDEHDPSPEHFSPLDHWKHILLQYTRRNGKFLIQQQAYSQGFQGMHIHVSVIDEFRSGLEKVAEAIAALPKKNDFVESDPETPREKALRLKQQPHSMSSGHGYDRKGRKR